MARLESAARIYEAAEQWTDTALSGDGSVLAPDQHLWTVDNIKSFDAAFTGNPLEGSEKFEEKLHQQLRDQPPEVIRLGAEMLWVLFLFPRKLIAAKRKQELIRMVWSWSDAQLDPNHPMLADAVMAGIGNAGTAFNTQRDRELEGLIDAVYTLKHLEPPVRTISPWKAGELIDEVPKAARRTIRNILLHLLFPDHYERIASFTHKRQIVAAFATLLPSDWPVPRSPGVELDRQLLDIRRKLEEQSPGKRLDFYDPELRAIWEAGPVPLPDPALQRRRKEAPHPVGLKLTNDPADAGMERALDLARAAGLAEPTPDLILAGFLALIGDPLYESFAAAALSQRMSEVLRHRRGSETDPLRELLKRHGLEPPAIGQPRSPTGPAAGLSIWPASIWPAASQIRTTVAPAEPLMVSPRHILAVLLLPGRHSAAPVLAELGFDPMDLRKTLLTYVEGRRQGEDRDAWRRVLLGATSAPDLPVYAGFSTDALRTDEAAAITSKDDRLGVMRDVAALSEVLAARETRPPLAVGLFGDWGTGKSFFMELMRQEIEQLGTRNPSFYCGRVVQVWFNAWHYMESNLWASLAARVFEELAEHLEKWKVKEDERAGLFERLQESQGVLAEAVSERNEARAQAEALRTRREQKERSFTATAATALRAATAALSADPEVQRKLRAAKDRLGLSAAEADVTRAEEQARQIRSLGGRMAAIGRALIRRPVLLGAGIVVFAAVGVAATWLLDNYDLLRGPAGVLAAVAAWLAALAAAVAPAARQVERGVRWLEDVATRLQQQRDSEQRQEKLALERELMRLEEREREAGARVEALNREIDELRAGRRLQRFIVERHASAEYRQHLGLVNLIRKDFEQLSTLLLEARKEPSGEPAEAARRPGEADGSAAVPDGAPKSPPLPKIDRIILYIDDLDRCPEDRVVQVLQAVHLLLAFPLFVVVVGVDSRWLLLSLEDHYAALRGRAADGGGSRKEIDAEWSTTPQNYLEKIFQIPFSLRPMEPDGFGSLVESLLPAAEAADETEPPASPAEERDREAPGEVAETPPRSTSAAGGESRSEEPDGEDGDEGEDVDNGDGEEPDEEHHLPVPAVPPNPLGLTVEPRERELIRKLHPLIASPRALKRFTNVYRFLRVQQRGPALDRFRGTETARGEFEVVALLLAAVVGYPAEAARLLRSVLVRQTTPWWSLVEELDEPGVKDGAQPRAQGTADHPGANEERGRTSLRAALLKLKEAGIIADHPPETFVRWTREVARFSFQSSRILSVHEPGGGRDPREFGG